MLRKWLLPRRNLLVKAFYAICLAAFYACRPRSLDQNPETSGSEEENDVNLHTNKQSILKSFDTELKRIARDDYQKNNSASGGFLSLEDRKLKNSYDVVVIGSGYGASIAAARIAERLKSTKSICMLERGKEWRPGDFPDTVSQFRQELRTDNQRFGLYDITFHDDMVVLQGNGLGGTSLINANVADRPDDSIFLNPRWPAVYRNGNVLHPYFTKVEQTLGLVKTAINSSGKVEIHNKVSAKFNAVTFRSLKLAITNEAGKGRSEVINATGLVQRNCTLCGDCMSGCNVGAKNTLPYNYLAKAKRKGAEIFCGMEVERIEKKADGSYFVHTRNLNNFRWWSKVFGKDGYKTEKINAKMVVIAAGSLGSTGILLRSLKSGLPVSAKIGYGFSGNGDYFGVVRDIDTNKFDVNLDIAGKGAYETSNRIGPTIQSAMEFNETSVVAERYAFEDLSVPRAVVPLLRLLTGAMDQAMLILGMSHDGQAGRIVLDRNETPRIEWKGASKQPMIGKMNISLRRYVEKAFAKTGKIVEWSEGRRLVTAHPLGGCSMSDDPTKGVVDARGRVYASPSGSIHQGLFVVDGSIIPTSIGTNPFLTISAVSEYVVDKLVNAPENSSYF